MGNGRKPLFTDINMAKKSKTLYAPGELSRVRGKLGDLDVQEAKRMVQILGGEIGYERTQEEEAQRQKPKTRRETVELVIKNRHSSRSSRNRIDTIEPEEEDAHAILPAATESKSKDPSDDPSAQLKASYSERVKMDRYASLPEFDIKTSMQALISRLAVFNEPPDYVNPLFVTRRLNEYYRHIEQLVTSTRTLFPRNNMKRSERLKKTSPFIFSILDTIRYWNIERITTDMAKIQAHPRTAKISEFSDILKAVYKPLFILEKLNTETDIKEAYILLYKLLYLENPGEAKTKYQELVKKSLSSFIRIRKDVHYLLYPLLMKLLSDQWFPYEQFFIQRRRRFMSFLKVSAADQINVPIDRSAQTDSSGIAAVRDEIQNEKNMENADVVLELEEEKAKEAENAQQKAHETGQGTEQKVLDRGLATMELLFPRAGWDHLWDYPDLYPYFCNILKLKKSYGLISPADPMQHISILMHILKEFFFALRYVSFGSIVGTDGNHIGIDVYLGNIINNWQEYVSDSIEKEYLSRLSEYCEMLEQSSESKNSAFGRRTYNELHWAKRLFYLPHYKFETIGHSPFQKKETFPVYKDIRLLRKYLTAVAAGIEQGNRQGGAQALAPCDGINNPWEPYNFEVSNPVSMRLDLLLAPKKRNNAALIYFCLSAAVVLDYLVNNENSWAYADQPGPLFRSVNDEGIIPLFGVDNKLDADLIFKMALKQRKNEKEQ